jgi:hypothetical protein
MRARIIALVMALGCAAGGCASAAGSPSAQQSTSQSPTSTKSPPTATVTVTSAAKPPSTTSPPTVTPPAAAQDPAAVVTAFYAAINAQDYATAWALGGDNLGSTYSSFAGGFAGTAHDTLTVTGVQGDTVDIHLEALQADGSTKIYDGSYKVDHGQIVEGQVSETGTVAPTASSPNAPITDPNGGYYARGEYCPDADAGLQTVDANGNILTCVFESGRYHWH